MWLATPEGGMALRLAGWSWLGEGDGDLIQSCGETGVEVILGKENT
jgi:hypothetical protein